MPSFPKGRSVQLAFAAVGIAYPFFVYAGLRATTPAILVVGLLGVLSLRLVLDRRGDAQQRFAPVLWVAAAGALLLVALSPLAGLQSYPVLVSLTFAGLFGHSLWHPPTVIERIARAREPDLPSSAIPYLRNVTLVWLGFFLANAAVSAATAMSGSLELWTLYNGLISYILVGALFAAELVVRQFVRRRHGDAG